MFVDQVTEIQKGSIWRIILTRESSKETVAKLCLRPHSHPGWQARPCII